MADDTTPTPEPGSSLPIGGAARARKAGRPPLLTSELTDKVAGLIRGGNYIEVAAAACGINRETLFRWLKQGARLRRRMDGLDDEQLTELFATLSDHDGEQILFSIAIEKAESESETIAVLRINKAGAAGAWQADMTRLERRKPKRWGRREAVEVTGQVDGVRVEAENTGQAVDASNALRDARARAAAADLLEALASDEEAAVDGSTGIR